MRCPKGRERSPRLYFQPILTVLPYGEQSVQMAGQGPHYQCYRFQLFGTKCQVVVIRWLTATVSVPLLRALLLDGLLLVPW